MTRNSEFRQATSEDCKAIADIARSLGADNVRLPADFNEDHARD